MGERDEGRVLMEQLRKHFLLFHAYINFFNLIRNFATPKYICTTEFEHLDGLLHFRDSLVRIGQSAKIIKLLPGI